MVLISNRVSEECQTTYLNLCFELHFYEEDKKKKKKKKKIYIYIYHVNVMLKHLYQLDMKITKEYMYIHTFVHYHNCYAFMPPTSKKLRGWVAYWFVPVRLSVFLSVRTHK